MQRSLVHFVCAAILIAVVLTYFPALLAPDALAQTTTLPYPTLITIENAAPIATTTPKIVAKKFVAAKAPESTSGPSLIIPSIGLDDPIVAVGTDENGAMAVPSGKTNEIGWYKGGPVPGQVGSAVLDAHVFAAFAKLDEVQVGDAIYVNENGAMLHFVVTATKEFTLSQITPADLFVQTSDRDLNLITCAGDLTPDHSTYDHRLVIYTTLVS